MENNNKLIDLDNIVRSYKEQLLEECYSMDNNIMTKTNGSILDVGEISYQEGKSGMHIINNISGSCSISLHVYSPPNYGSHFY